MQGIKSFQYTIVMVYFDGRLSNKFVWGEVNELIWGEVNRSVMESRHKKEQNGQYLTFLFFSVDIKNQINLNKFCRFRKSQNW